MIRRTAACPVKRVKTRNYLVTPTTFAFLVLNLIYW